MPVLADIQQAREVVDGTQEDLRRWLRLYRADRGRDATRYLGRIREVERRLGHARENLPLLTDPRRRT
jgi:hypothetical protein